MKEDFDREVARLATLVGVELPPSNGRTAPACEHGRDGHGARGRHCAKRDRGRLQIPSDAAALASG